MGVSPVRMRWRVCMGGFIRYEAGEANGLGEGTRGAAHTPLNSLWCVDVFEKGMIMRDLAFRMAEWGVGVRISRIFPRRWCMR